MEISQRSDTPPLGAIHMPEALVQEAAANLHGTVNKLAATADEAAGTVKPAIARVALVAHQTVDKVADVAQPTAAWLATQGENLENTRRNAVADARARIVANPWQSLGLALAAGFLIGRLAR